LTDVKFDRDLNSRFLTRLEKAAGSE
jgi:hypothetical protein